MKKYLFGTFFLILVLTATSFAVEIPPFHVMEPTPYRISGTVSGEILEGVTITLSSEEGPTRTTTTDSSGNYTFLNIIGTVSYTLSASKSGYIFSPASQGGSLQADFTASVRLDNIYLDNDGTGGDGSIDNPYGTLSGINWPTGSVNIHLKRGSVWNQLTFPESMPIKIQPYGTGSEPEIYGLSFE